MLCSGGWSVINTGSFRPILPRPSPLPHSSSNPCPWPWLSVPPGFTASTPYLQMEVSFILVCFPSTGSRYLGPSLQSPPSHCFQGMHSASELGKVWKKLLEAIPRPSVSHLHLFCGSCALTGNSKILRATSLHSNVNQYSVVSRWVPRIGQGTGGSGQPPEFCQFLLSFPG